MQYHRRLQWLRFIGSLSLVAAGLVVITITLISGKESIVGTVIGGGLVGLGGVLAENEWWWSFR